MIQQVQNKTQIGNYVFQDSDDRAGALLPLLQCLRFAVALNRPLDYFLKGIFTGEGTCGGDPGWVIEKIIADDTSAKYYAFISEDCCDPPNEGTYDEATVKKHVRATLENFRKAHPERTIEVDEVIARFGL